MKSKTALRKIRHNLLGVKVYRLSSSYDKSSLTKLQLEGGDIFTKHETLA